MGVAADWAVLDALCGRDGEDGSSTTIFPFSGRLVATGGTVGKVTRGTVGVSAGGFGFAGGVTGGFTGGSTGGFTGGFTGGSTGGSTGGGYRCIYRRHSICIGCQASARGQHSRGNRVHRTTTTGPF